MADDTALESYVRAVLRPLVSTPRRLWFFLFGCVWTLLLIVTKIVSAAADRLNMPKERVPGIGAFLGSLLVAVAVPELVSETYFEGQTQTAFLVLLCTGVQSALIHGCRWDLPLQPVSWAHGFVADTIDGVAVTGFFLFGLYMSIALLCHVALSA